MSSVSKTITGKGKQNPGAKNSSTPRVDIQGDSTTGNNLLAVGDGSSNSFEVRKDAIIIAEPINSNLDINGSIDADRNSLKAGAVDCTSITTNRNAITCGSINSFAITTNRNTITSGHINCYSINTNNNNIAMGAGDLSCDVVNAGYINCNGDLDMHNHWVKNANRYEFAADNDTWMGSPGDGSIDFVCDGQTLMLWKKDKFHMIKQGASTVGTAGKGRLMVRWSGEDAIADNGAIDGEVKTTDELSTIQFDNLINLATGSSTLDLKEQVADTAFSTEEILALRPVDFNWKADHRDNFRSLPERDTGLIAEEVAETMPHLAIVEDGKPTGVRYDKLGPLLLKVCRDQQAEIEALKGRLDALEEAK